jgi:hypothetical protein
MFQTTLTTLNSATNKPVWFQQPPVGFTSEVAVATQAVADLEKFCQAQETRTTGSAQDKDREEIEMEDAAHALGRALVSWFRKQGNETDAAKVDLSLTAWRRLRDQSVLEKARLAHSLAQGVTAGGQAAAAAEYGITAAAVQALGKEIDDYAKVIAAPQSAIGGRKSLTLQMRARFNAVEAGFATLDDLILQFNKTAAGRALIAAYQASRVVRDLGHGPGPQPPAPSPAPTT